MTFIFRKLLFLFSLLATIGSSTAASAIAPDGTITIEFSGPSKLVQGERVSFTVRVSAAHLVTDLLVSSAFGKIEETGSAGGRYAFSLHVGSAAPIGKSTIAALAVLDNGVRLRAAPREITIEPAAQFARISFDTNAGYLNFIGDSRPVEVSGVSEDGTSLRLSSSSRLKLRTSDSKIAIIDDNRNVVMTGVGSTIIEAAYHDERTGASLSGTQSVALRDLPRGELDGARGIDIGDFNVIASFIEQFRGQGNSRPVRIVNDGRDLRRDGLINQADLEIMLQLCRFPNCDFRPLKPNEAKATPLFTASAPTRLARTTPSPIGTSVPSEIRLHADSR